MVAVLWFSFCRLDHLPKVCSFLWIVGAGFPNNGLGLESPATMICARTYGKWSNWSLAGAQTRRQIFTIGQACRSADLLDAHL
jgi:hypothetical protein